jgi:hypothetical protein
MATTKKRTFKDYRLATGLSTTNLAWKAGEMTGTHIPSDLIDEIERELLTPDDRPRAPIAEPKAQALARFFSQELGRTISVEDLGLEVM